MVKNKISRKLTKRPLELAHSILPNVYRHMDPIVGTKVLEMMSAKKRNSLASALNHHILEKSKTKHPKWQHFKMIFQRRARMAEEALCRLHSRDQLSVCPSVKPLIKQFERMK